MPKENTLPRQLHALALMAALLGCEQSQQDSTGPTEVEMVALMEGHYTSAIAGHDALIRGDLEALRRRLSEIQNQSLPAKAPPGWKPFHTTLRQTAQRATRASSIEAAATELGAIAQACGTCHAGLNVGDIYFWPAPKAGETERKTMMRSHQWATERLWEGVTGPFDEAWKRGAAALSESGLFAAKGKGVTADLSRREEALRLLGQQAQAATALPERAVVYGRLLATCAGCHQAAGIQVKHATPWQQDPAR